MFSSILQPPMKSSPLASLLLSVAAAFAGSTGTASAATLYFDQNGTTAGFGITAGSTYDWGNGAPSTWNTSNTGGSGTISGWNNSNGDLAAFTPGSIASWGVNLTSNVTASGITTTTHAGGAVLSISATSSRTLTFNSGSLITNNMGAARVLAIRDNVDLAGDFNLTGNARFSIEGTGSNYVGTITTTGGSGNLASGANNRYGTGTKVVLNTGGSIVVGQSSMTIGELSGSGGTLVRGVVTGNTLTVDQAGNTKWSGAVGVTGGAGALNFTKAGSGKLVLDGAADNAVDYTLAVNGGSLHVAGNLTSVSADARNHIDVGTSGNFGGTTASSKRVILLGAGSTLSPGMYDLVTDKQQVGTLTLANGLTATTGGTFRFTLNADDGGGGSLNSLINVTGGTLSLGGTLTADFLNFGTGNIQAGTPYTIFSASGISTTGWTVGSLPAGWSAGATPFSVSGNNLQITFSAIPEPRSVVFVLAGGLYLALGSFCRRRSTTLF